jgi:hypothetical protein
MGVALIWVEGLMVAVLTVALATAWAARGRSARWLWPAVVYLAFFAPAGFLALATYNWNSDFSPFLRTNWIGYTLSWFVAFALSAAFVMWSGRRRLGAGLARPAAVWPRRRLWLSLGGAALALGLTVWNVDLSVRADLAVARQEAGALLLAMTPPPVADAENAARIYQEAAKDLPKDSKEYQNPWRDAARRGVDAREPADWKDPYVVGLVKKHEGALVLLRKAATTPRCNFDYQRGMFDSVRDSSPDFLSSIGRGIVPLAFDARVKATQGNLAGAFEDVTAILGIFRHLAGYPDMGWGMETIAWRTLEDLLRLAPPGKDPLPALAVPELFPLVRKVREEQAMLGMIFPAAASQPSLMLDKLRKQDEYWTALLVESLVVPARVFVMPDELAAMQRLFEEYQRSPRFARDETPNDWADLRASVETDPTSMLSVIFMKPKHRKLMNDGAELACLRQTAQAGLAVAAYRRKHGKAPERFEQLVPEFLPAVPTDPRDGQPLRLKRTADDLVIYSPHDATVVDSGKLRDPENWRPAPIFRLPADTP